MRANQRRLWFASMADALICALRRIGLAHTRFARASCGTIRLRLLKIGARWCAPAGAASSSPCPRPAPIRPSTAPRRPHSPQRPDEPENAVNNNPATRVGDHCPRQNPHKLKPRCLNPQPPLCPATRPPTAPPTATNRPPYEKCGLAQRHHPVTDDSIARLCRHTKRPGELACIGFRFRCRSVAVPPGMALARLG